MKKIIIFASQPLEKRNYYRFGLDIFSKENWQVIYCNLAFSTFKYDTKKKKVKKNLKNVKIFNISNIRQLSKILANIEGYYYADFSAYSLLKIYANIKLSRKNTRLEFRINNYPQPQKKFISESFYDFKNFFKENNKIHKINRMIINNLNKLFSRFFYEKSILFYAGKKLSYSKNHLKKISIHTMDYDIFLRNPSNKKKQNTVTFLDQYLENHPDFKTHVRRTVVTKKKYFFSLNRFFDKLEKNFKLKTIIAIHPRAPFNNSRFQTKKKVFYGSYSALTNSKLVIAHDSVAVNFVSILKKPVIFIYTDEMIKNFPKIVLRIKLFAKELGTTAINIDKDININRNDYSKINEKKYNVFFKNYISDNKKNNLLFWKKVINELNKFTKVNERK